MGKFGKDMGARGTYDTRNKMNDLTGKEWLKSTTSVWNSETKMDKIGKTHPAPFSYIDVQKLIELFTKKGMTVLDPFVGVGSTLIACSKSNRNGIGIDINNENISLSKERFKLLGINPKKQTLICGDSFDKIDQIDEIDYCVTSPPYHNILRNKGQGIRHDKSQTRQGVKYYSELKKDLGNQEKYIDFLDLFHKIMKKVFEKLRINKYTSVIVSDITINKKETDFSGDIIKEMQKAGFEFKGRVTLIQNQKTIYPFGYPFSYVINHTNQYILNFKKNG